MAKRRGKILLAAGVCLLGGLLFLAALPLWLPLVLRPAAARAGAHFKSYTAEGYGRVILRDVVVTNKAITLHAERVEFFQPISWLWFSKISRSVQPSNFARVDNWNLSFPARTNAAPRSKPLSSLDQARTVEGVLKQLRRWVPAATASNGTIQIGPTALNIPYAAWSLGSFRGAAEFPRWGQAAAVSADLASDDHHHIEINSESLHLRSEILTVNEPTGLAVFSTNTYWSNRFEARAHMGRGGVLPETAELEAVQVALPATLVGLKNYQSLNGDLTAHWDRGHFDLTVSGGAQPSAKETNLPPVRVELSARGDTNAANISLLSINSPGLTATLSQPLTIHFHGPLMTENATVRITADLGAQTVIPAQGNVEGEVDLSPGQDRFPSAHFRLAGKSLGFRSFHARRIDTEGMLRWPELFVTNALVRFEDGTRAVVSGEMDLATRVVENGALQSAGTSGCEFLPKRYTYESTEVLATFQGAITNLSHQGRLTLDNVRLPGFPLIQLQADWSGRLADLDRIALNLRTTNSSLAVTGACAVKAGDLAISLDHLVWNTNKQEALRLIAPVRASFVVPTGGSNGWHLALSDLQLAGKAGQIHARTSVAWPRQGSGEIQASGLSTELVRGFIPPGPGTLSLENLDARAAWSNGPAQFQIALAMKGEAGESLARQIETFQADAQKPASSIAPALRLPTSFHVEFLAGGNATGIVISNLLVNSETSSIVTARGSLPLRLVPQDRTNLIQIDENLPIAFSAVTKPDALLWEQLSAWVGVNLQAPDLQLHLDGTWANPKGSVNLTARQIKLPALKTRIPALENLKLRVEMDRQSARLIEGSLLIQRQPFALTGEIPLGKKFWEGIRENHVPDLRQASAHLQMRKVELAALAELYPTLLSPEGEINADVELLPGEKLRGQFVLSKGRTRPFPGVGPVRDINISLKLSDTELVLESASGIVGGSMVLLSGKTAVPDMRRLGKELPPFEFRLSGTNVPLSRQPESIIRSDLDLSLRKTNGAPPLITGTAHLRDSFYLSDVTALVPARVSSPRRRPPYFSVETPELANWRIAANVTGEKALRVRSTLFNGQASAHLRLLGTLESPLAIGDLQINNGSVKFPFGVLEVQQGFVTLGGGDPYRPQLQITASAKQFGYDIHMEVSGPADTPVIQFNSTPPLSSEQILLMITAGEVPNSGLNITPQQRAQTVALFLGKDLLTKLGFSDGDSEDRLTVHSGEEVSEQGKPTYSLEYKLTKRWALVGEYDRFNAFNAGLKWHVFSK